MARPPRRAFNFVRRGMDRQITESRGGVALDLGAISLPRTARQSGGGRGYRDAPRFARRRRVTRYKAASRIAVGRIAWAADRATTSQLPRGGTADIRAIGDEAGSALAACWFWIVATASWTRRTPRRAR
jgi:hypothetical protein